MNEPELRQLMLHELDAVRRMARHLIRQGDSARISVDDVVQEAYLRALQGLQNFTLDPRLGVRPWLFRILHHVIVQRVTKDRRDRLREAVVSQESQTTAGESDADLQPWLSHADAKIDWDRVDDRLAAAIEELADPLRSTFLLLAAGELSYKEIAATLDVPVGTVMSRIARARKQLMASLDDLARDRRLKRTEPRNGPARRPEESGNLDA